VDDRLASREHARIVVEGDAEHREYVLMDNESTNGTFLNNQQVSRAMLHDGDKVRIGSTILRFSYHDAIDAEYHRRIYDLITYDDLTGLLTLRPFYRELERELSRTDRLGLPLALLMMDLDHFKAVNDSFGHQTGSHVIKECGRLIRHALRYNDAAARYGGEEFIAYLPNADRPVAEAAAEAVRAAVDGHSFEYNGNRPRLTISIGVAWFPEDGKALDVLVRRADERLYRAKERGRNRVVSADLPGTALPPA
jgi:diguanylate cyclase (GGDEF)-like protein